jgi:hypothetical protein
MVVNTFDIQNNIIQGFTGGTNYSAGVFGTAQWGTNDINDLTITNNDFYGNANNVLFVSGYSPSPYTNNSNITGNPVLDAEWKIKNTSPAYMKGIDVGLITDFANNRWNRPPSMGAYDYVLTPAMRMVKSGDKLVFFNNMLITTQ